MFEEIRFYIDPETGEPHIFQHGVSCAEVEAIFRNFHLTLSGRKSARGNSQIAFGQTDDGRYLKVVYTVETLGGGVFVITAYDLRGKELLAFRRRLRRRNR